MFIYLATTVIVANLFFIMMCVTDYSDRRDTELLQHEEKLFFGDDMEIEEEEIEDYEASENEASENEASENEDESESEEEMSESEVLEESIDKDFEVINREKTD